MSGGKPVRGVVLAHGELARAMADAVRRISGVDEEALVPVTNEGSSPETLAGRLDELLGDGEAVVFTDLRTGSCAFAARYACREDPRRAVVFGANLGMLIDFVFHRELPLDELVPRLLGKAKGEIAAEPEPDPGP